MTTDMVQPAGDILPIRLVEGVLRTFFDRYPSSTRTFSCTGTHQYFDLEISVLKDRFKWTEIDTSSSVTGAAVGCLLLSIDDLNSIQSERFLAKADWPCFLLLHIPIGGKKSGVFAYFESFGYHIYREWDEIAYLYRMSPAILTLSSGHKLGDKDIRTLLEKSWRRIRNLPENTEVDCISADARELLVPRRFDIAIKSHYARLWLQEAAVSWRKYVYFEQVLRITGPGSEIIEHGTDKKGLRSFFSTFHSLLAPLDPADVPSIPVDSTLTAYDGSHRIAAAIAFKRNVRSARIDDKNSLSATAAYFQKSQQGHSPCPVEILDESAIEYCRIKDTVAIALIFPSVSSEKAAIRELEKISEVVYRKDIVLSPEAGGALFRQVYHGHPWLNQSSESNGFLHKQKSCFPFSGVLRVVLLDRIDPKTLRSTKEKIRSLYGIGNHSIHITDSCDETLRVARALFNHNSVDLLNTGIGTLPGFHEKLFLYRDWLDTNGIDGEMVCVDGSAVLALLGHRECRDLDFLYHGNPDRLPPAPDKIDCHNSQAQYHAHSIDDIVGDPRLHCWYMGVKFCTPQIMIEMKRNRGEKKDYKDIVLLQSSLPGTSRIAVFRAGFVRVTGYGRALLAVPTRKIKDLLRPVVNYFRANTRK